MGIWNQIMADDLDLAGLACDIQSRSHAADAASGDVDALQVRVTVAVFQRVFECLVLTVLIFLDIYDVEIRITGRQLFLEAFQSALVAGQAGGADDDAYFAAIRQQMPHQAACSHASLDVILTQKTEVVDAVDPGIEVMTTIPSSTSWLILFFTCVSSIGNTAMPLLTL